MPDNTYPENGAGSTDLQQLLANMSPELRDGEFVFLSIAGAVYGDHVSLQPLATMHEDDGLTLVVPKHLADVHHHHYEGIFRCITLQVHSSLEAVGLTAAFAKQLTLSGISANVIAGFFHDHLFVPIDDADRAIEALLALTRPA